MMHIHICKKKQQQQERNKQWTIAEMQLKEETKDIGWFSRIPCSTFIIIFWWIDGEFAISFRDTRISFQVEMF